MFHGRTIQTVDEMIDALVAVRENENGNGKLPIHISSMPDERHLLDVWYLNIRRAHGTNCYYVELLFRPIEDRWKEARHDNAE